MNYIKFYAVFCVAILFCVPAAADLNICPRMPTAAATVHNWISAINAAGQTTLSQPAFTDISGTALYTQGGTGLTSIGTANQLFGVNNGATGYEAKGVTATAAGTMIVPTGQLLEIPDGTVANPSLTFANENSSGLSRIGTGDVALSVGGSVAIEVLQLGSNYSFGFGTPAIAGAGNALQAGFTYNGPAQFNYSNYSGLGNAVTQFVIGAGPGGGAGLNIENHSYHTTSVFAGGSALRATAGPNFLTISSEQVGGYINFLVGGAVAADEAMRLSSTGTVLGKGFGTLGMSGATSGVFSQTANTSTSSYSVIWPAAQATGALTNDGSGNLSWSPAAAGTVTAVSVSSSNGFTGTSSGGATPALTLATSVTGVLKGNGTAISAATSGTDYSAGTSALGTGILKSTTSTGALTVAVAGDFPTLNQNTSGTAVNVTASSNSTLTTLSNLSLPYSQLSGSVPTWNQNTSGTAAGLSATLVTGSGGTGVTSVTTVPAASAFAGWDANKNMTANSHIPAFTTTATAAGTTALLVGSTQLQYFTGSTTQTVTLPVASGLVAGQQYTIVNQSTGVVTVQSSGLNTLQAMAANTQLVVTCILNSGTGTASWTWNYGTIASAALPLAAGGTGATSLASGAISSNGSVLASGTLSVLNGGTAKTSVTTSPSASSWAGWDTNSNMTAQNFIEKFTTTATAAGTTALVVGSTGQQYFTGSTTQTVTMPVTSGLVLGQQYTITNLSTGVVTVQSSGTNNIQAMAANSTMVLTCILTSGTTAASWSYTYSSVATTTLPIANPMTTGGDIVYGGASGLPTRLANGTSTQYLKSTGGTSAPAWTSLSVPTKQIFTSAGSTTGYLFFISSGNATVGATYTNNSVTFTVLNTIAAGTQLFTSSAGAPTASGTLTKASGTGDATITFSSDAALATYTPTAGTGLIKVTLVGGGGGSGGNVAGGATCSASGGGGGGGTSIKWITSPAASYPYLIGTGGSAGASGTNIGSSGSTNYFGSNLMIANGGAGGAGGSTISIGPDGIGGNGGGASGGDLNIVGGVGGTGLVFSTSLGIGGQGGISQFSSGASDFVNGSGVGVAGNTYGGGATGGMSQATNGAQTGSAGAAGVLIIEEYTQ